MTDRKKKVSISLVIVIVLILTACILSPPNIGVK